MNRITEITKRDIADLFQMGMDVFDIFETRRVTYFYYGRLEEIEFLERLYDLKSMPSSDSRFKDAKGDIIQHTVSNDDYELGWVFRDERFELQNGSDEKYLKFICEIFHPAVRDEGGYWKEYLSEVNRLLNNDGYELYPTKKISNRDIYGWRILQPENNMFIPYSQRNAKAIKAKKITLSINRNARNQIYQLLIKFDNVYQETNETGWNYTITTREKVFDNIRQFYTPKCYNDQNQFVETSSLEEFVCHSSPFYVIDAIEFYEKYNQNNDFESNIKSLLKLNEISLKLYNGKIEDTYTSQIKNNTLEPIQEVGLKELLQEAAKYYDEGNYKIAVEKLWDAFERLKTYYSPTLDKKKSVNKLIEDMSNSKEAYIKLFDKEFLDLTTIGNEFRIRHHETTKTDIEDNRHYDFFYKRCLSLISITIQYLDSGGMV
jgi:DNA-binding cell septation regulator SpoVG